jgi:predicted permease
VDAGTVKVYRLLLRLFPAAFRTRFGDDMADVFSDRLREAREGGWRSVAALWVRTLADIAAHAAAERQLIRARSRRRGGGFMLNFAGDLWNAVRAHARRPWFALTGAAMLAGGLGFNIALFAVVHAVVLRPLPYSEPSRLALLWTGRFPNGSVSVNSWADMLDWKARSHTFESMAAYNIDFSTIAPGGEPEQISGAAVSPDFFRVLGARPALGRGIEPGDETIGAKGGVPIVLSTDLWQRRYGSDPGILQQTITVNGEPRRVVGVMSARFIQPEPKWDRPTEFWSPLHFGEGALTNHAYRYLRVVGRLAPNATMAQAGREMDEIGVALMHESPRTNPRSVIVVPIVDALAGDVTRLSWVFLGAAGLVLLLGVANIVNLLLARANERRAELAIRTALGASRGRLVSQLVAESTVIGIAGGVLGLLVARGGVGILIKLAPIDASGLNSAAVDWWAAGFALVISVITGALCGVLPAWRVARARLSGVLADMRGSMGLDASRGRAWLVGAEVALAVPLVVGATLLTRTLVQMQHVDPGFDAADGLQFRVDVPATANSTPTATAFIHSIESALAAGPGVAAVGAVSSLPMGGLNNTGGSVVYESPDGTPHEIGVGFRSTTPGYFAAMGIPTQSGRLFDLSPSDDHSVVVNDVAAAIMWGQASAIGRRVRFGAVTDDPKKNDWLTIAGVVGSVRHEALTRTPQPEVFVPYQSWTFGTMTFVVRTVATTPSSLGPSVRQVVRRIDPTVAVVGLAPLETVIDRELAAPKLGVLAAATFGGLAIVLAACGLFAVLSLLVAQRRKEIGIRMALGATAGAVGRRIMRDTLVPILCGSIAGTLVALTFSRALAPQLFGVTPRDPVAFTASLGALLAAAIAAGWLPTRRAMTTDPIRALREG